MKLFGVICFTVLCSLIVASLCEAFERVGNWIASDMLIARFAPRLWAHDAFYPHAHMRDLKAAAKRGKILVVTLIVSVGLVVLVSGAILKGGKGTDEVDTVETIDPAELRAWVVASATAGGRELLKSREQAMKVAFREYARARGIEWRDEGLQYSPSATRDIGKDRVTVTVGDSSIEIRAMCGNMGAEAIADMADNSIKSSIFTSHALEKESET